MRNTFTFGSYTSSTNGVYISGSGVYNAPERDYDPVKVPGRSGDLILSGESYRNIEVTYPAFISNNFKTNLANFRSNLLSVNGYAKLTDTYHTDEFRAAYFPGPLEVSARSQNDAGEFDITFICKPQRFLVSGETAVTVASGGSISNPTLYAAKPSIHVVGYGTLTIGSDVIEIANVFNAITIDSEIMDCYEASGVPVVNSAIVGQAVLKEADYMGNANNAVEFSSNEFPLLKPGTTGITYDNTITSVTIVPRWWRL